MIRLYALRPLLRPSRISHTPIRYVSSSMRNHQIPAQNQSKKHENITSKVTDEQSTPKVADEKQGKLPQGTMSRLVREYGRIAFVVYGALTFTTFCCCYLSIVYLGVDVHALLHKFHNLRHSAGLGAITDAEQTTMNQVKDEKGKERNFFSWQTWLLALAMTKVFVPVKLGLTAAFTPTVAKILRQRGWAVGTKKFNDVRPKIQ
jgi:hypothetical protein